MKHSPNCQNSKLKTKKKGIISRKPRLRRMPSILHVCINADCIFMIPPKGELGPGQDGWYLGRLRMLPPGKSDKGPTSLGGGQILGELCKKNYAIITPKRTTPQKNAFAL